MSADTRKEWFARAGGIALLALCLVLGRLWMGQAGTSDADRHYHFALSRMASWTGRIAAVPQAEDIGWGKHFADKEYLFHVFTAWGDRLAGERGVVAASMLLAFLACAALFSLCRLGTGAVPAACFGVGGAVGSAYWAHRLVLLRPQVLAIAAVLWLCWALVARRPVLAALAGAAFALGYHGFYIVLALVLLYVLAHRTREAVRLGGASVVGLLIGTLANPYFPSNVAMGLLTAEVGWGAHQAKTIGFELLPLSTSEFLLRFGAPLALLAAVGLRPWFRPPSADAPRGDPLFLTVAALCFWGLAALTPRAAEYAVPLSAAAAAHALADLPMKWQASLAGLTFAAQLPAWADARTMSPGLLYGENVVEAISRLPPEAAGKKVFNCVFDEGTALLHLRPDVRFVDLLDPAFLQRSAPALSDVREQFTRGDVPDAARTVRQTFHADYVLCGYPAAIALLDRDPRFRRLYPAPDVARAPPFHALYALVDAPIPSARRFDVQGPFTDPATPRELQLLPDQPFLDLGSLHLPRDEAGCERLAVAPDEVQRLAGAEVALVGGGPDVSFLLDGAPTVSFRAERGPGRWNDVLVELPQPLSASSRPEVRLCPGAPSSPHGVGVSFWRWSEVESRCDALGRARSQRQACLAPRLFWPRSR